MKKLLVLRHAEAGMSLSGGDHSRDLTARGEEEARQVGRLLLEHSYWPDAVLVSDAMRTRQTAIWIGSVMGEKGSTPMWIRVCTSARPALSARSSMRLLRPWTRCF
ncbi:histidine phosphatase family protein [Nesterenkonia pannonica]|uniref:SixA phosphatase family protein n=1 Tax=Nesterenkonia pannonica TaxID=1548602 RepID=UPI0021646E96|nr:histidine phosphatase family protein [Nesterenkonia pannonica]